MISRQTKSTPVIWIPHVVGPSHGHTHGGRRQDIGRPRTVDHDSSSNFGQRSKNPSDLKVFVVDHKKGATVLCCATLFTCVQIAIGALNMGTLIYSLSVGDLHSILVCIAYHLFSAEAILVMSYKNGWSLLMGYDNRTLCHTILQILSLICAIAGMTIKLVVTGVSDSAHCIAGLVTAAVSIPTIILGPIGLFKKSKTLKNIHVFFGLATFLCASLCFCLAIFKDQFRDWCKQNSGIVKYIMLLLIFYIALVMIILVICKIANVDMLRTRRRR